MAYADLTTEEKSILQANAAVLRPILGELARVMEKAQAVVSHYAGNVETILGELQNGDAIPNESGLAGAQSLTKSEYVNLVGYLINLAATADNAAGSYNTNYHRALYAKAAGPGNLI